jgi:hypothetical protein
MHRIIRKNGKSHCKKVRYKFELHEEKELFSLFMRYEIYDFFKFGL